MNQPREGFTESNDEFLNGVRGMLANGTIAKKTTQVIKADLEKTTDPLQILHILEKHIRFVAIEREQISKKFQNREVILSGYLVK
jgi:hypothetical protein